MSPKLRIALDWGTTQGKAAVALVEPGEVCEIDEIYPISFGGAKNCSFPMVGEYFQVEGKEVFLWGWKLVQMSKNNELPEDQAVHLHKLALYESHKNTPVTRKVTQAFGGKALVEFIADFMSAVMDFIMDWAKKFLSQSSKGFTWTLGGKTFKELEKEVQITVPLVFTPSSTKEMMDAAIKAEFEKTELVQELIAAAAYTLAALKKRLGRQNRPIELDKGSKMMCVDLGGGTTDIINITIDRNPSYGATTELGVVGQPGGAPCGSNLIKEDFLGWLPKVPEVLQMGGIKGICDRLELSETSLLAKFSPGFDSRKKEPQWDRVEWIGVSSHASQEGFSVAVSKERMKGFFDTVADKAIAAIQKEIQADTDVIVLLGGLAHSEYITERIRQAFASFNGRSVTVQNDHEINPADHPPCSYGPLIRYPGIEARAFPSNYSFGIGQCEEFSFDHHPDAYFKKDTPAKRRCRMNWNVGQTPSKEISDLDAKWRIHYFSKKETQVYETIYWSDHDTKEHTAIRPEGPEGPTDARIHPCTMVTADFHPGKNGYKLKLKPGTKTKQVYEVWFAIRIVSDGANTEVKWDFLRGNCKPPFDGKWSLTSIRTFGTNVAVENGQKARKQRHSVGSE